MVFPIQSAGSATAHTAPPLRVATAGEALFDLIEEPDGRLKPCAGGAVYNLTRALGLQGVGTQYLNPLAGDMLGRPGPRPPPASRGPVGGPAGRPTAG